MTKLKYRVNLKKSHEGYAVWCPGLPDCWSQGHTKKEALENIKDAIRGYLAVAQTIRKDVESHDVDVIVR